MQIKDLFRTKSISQILKEADEAPEHELMAKELNVKDLTFFGIAALVGAGIFSTIGTACFDGGPAVVFLFLGIAVACGFSAYCYAEFASRVPVSGSAYTYSYATFGELVAWIIGWDLLMEYAIGNITVAISWSGNFTTFLKQLGITIPANLSTSWLEVYNGHEKFLELLAKGEAMSPRAQALHDLWLSAPKIGSIPFILNIPAFVITVLITSLVYIGIKESRNVSNFMVIFKVAVVLLVAIIGAFYINPENWVPFAPNGATGVLKGVSAVFFAYIGFDAISTTAEECKNPQRDLPRSMMYSLLIATGLYVSVSLVLTGMVKYDLLNNEAFLANAFTARGLNWIGGMIAFSALIATASVLLVFQMGQPRIWMSMSRDGLLPKKFAEIHPKFKTPAFSTLLTGFIVAVPSMFLDSALVTDLCSIGTLFAFILVCGGILLLQNRTDLPEPKFKVPYLNGQLIVPVVFAGTIAYLFLSQNADIQGYVSKTFSFEGGFEKWQHNIPTWTFFAFCAYISAYTFLRKYSLIPVLGLLSCSYLLSTLGFPNWMRFIIWLFVGLVIYFVYGYWHSKLGREAELGKKG